MLQRAAQTNTSGSLTLLALVEHAEAMAEADADAAAAVAGGVYALDDFAAFPPKTQARVAALAAKGIPLSEDVLAKLAITPPRRNTAAGRAAMDVVEVINDVSHK